MTRTAALTCILVLTACTALPVQAQEEEPRTIHWEKMAAHFPQTFNGGELSAEPRGSTNDKNSGVFGMYKKDGEIVGVISMNHMLTSSAVRDWEYIRGAEEEIVEMDDNVRLAKVTTVAGYPARVAYEKPTGKLGATLNLANGIQMVVEIRNAESVEEIVPAVESLDIASVEALKP